MDHSNHVRLDAGEITLDTLKGATIYGPDDSEISSIDHVHGSGANAEVAFDVGGFLGIGSKRVSLRADQLDFMRDEDGIVHAVTTLTEDQLKELPDHVERPLAD